MPSSEAMATAVSLWSPVIMIGRMPALRHSSMAALTSGRTGSIMPVRPMKYQVMLERLGRSNRRARSRHFLIAGREHAQAPDPPCLLFSEDYCRALSRSVIGTILSVNKSVGAEIDDNVGRALWCTEQCPPASCGRWTSSFCTESNGSFADSRAVCFLKLALVHARGSSAKFTRAALGGFARRLLASASSSASEQRRHGSCEQLSRRRSDRRRSSCSA